MENQVDTLDEGSIRPLILDKSDPGSVHRMVPDWLSRRIENIPNNYWEMDPKELKAKVRPGYTLDALRTAFWVEYHRAAYSGNGKIILTRVYGGICSQEYFISKATKSDLYLAWMLTPPLNYLNSLKALLSFSTERLYDVVGLKIERGKKVDYKAADLILKVHEMLEARLKGKPVETRFNVNYGKQVDEASAELLEENLNRRLSMLRKQEEAVENGAIETEGRILSGDAAESDGTDAGGEAPEAPGDQGEGTGDRED